MQPEDYKPFPDDGMGFGDYPDLGYVSTDMKSNFEEYDDQYGKRNFGEVVHIGAEQISEDKISFRELPISRPMLVVYHFLAVFLFFGIIFLFDSYKLTVPVLDKQYPRNVGETADKKHYKI